MEAVENLIKILVCVFKLSIDYTQGLYKDFNTVMKRKNKSIVSLKQQSDHANNLNAKMNKFLVIAHKRIKLK